MRCEDLCFTSYSLRVRVAAEYIADLEFWCLGLEQST